MHTWHPLPPPVMIPALLLNTQLFSAGVMGGVCLAAGLYLGVSGVRWLHSAVRSLASSKHYFPVLVLLLLVSAPAHAYQPGYPGVTFTVPMTSNNFNSPSGGSGWTITQGAGQTSVYLTSATGTSGTSGGWTYAFTLNPDGTASASLRSPVTISPGSYGLSQVLASGQSFGANFTISPMPAPSANCTSSYPSTVSMYLADAPSPCAYFQASQGFNASSSPLLLAVLGVLAIILAIWLGHDTVMSIVRRLLAGATGSNR